MKTLIMCLIIIAVSAWATWRITKPEQQWQRVNYEFAERGEVL